MPASKSLVAHRDHLWDIYKAKNSEAGAALKAHHEALRELYLVQEKAKSIRDSGMEPDCSVEQELMEAAYEAWETGEDYSQAAQAVAMVLWSYYAAAQQVYYDCISNP